MSNREQGTSQDATRKPTDVAGRTGNQTESPTTSATTAAALAAAHHARRMHLGVTATLAALTAIVYLVVAVRSRPELPDTMATHWNLSGVADGFMATTAALLLQGVLIIGVPLGLLLVFGSGRWWLGHSARQLSATIAGFSVTLTTMFVVLTRAHVGIADPTTVSLDWRLAALFIASGVITALLCTAVLPANLPPNLLTPPTPVRALDISPSDRVSWFGRARSSQAMLAVLAFAVVIVGVSAVASGIWWLWLMVALLMLLVLAFTSFEVRIDSSGVSWRSAIGLPRGTVAVENISAVSIVDVNPGDFGGFGLRYLPGRVGIITRTGSALSVEHRGRVLVITVDEADQAAAVVEGLRLRSSRTSEQ